MEYQALLSDPDAIIIDTETTGLDASAEIVEIAIVAVASGRVLYNALVIPRGSVPSAAAAIHGLDKRTIRKLGGEPWEKHWPEVARIIEQASVIVGWNIKFDLRMIRQTSVGHSPRVPATSRKSFDLLQFYRDIFQHKGNGWRLEQVMDREGLTWEGEKHRALTDCMAVRQIMMALARKELPGPATGSEDEDRAPAIWKWALGAIIAFLLFLIFVG